jgi:hypothetical protein
MKIWKLAALATLFACGGAIAQEVEETIAFKLEVTDDGAAESTSIHWVGKDLDLDSLAVGESRTVAGESGEMITVTRTDDGLQFDVDGETIVLPDVSLHGEHATVIDIGGDQEIDVEVHAEGPGPGSATAVGTQSIRAMPMEGVTIISGVPLDDSVRESIRSVLISAGIGEEVRFIDHGDEDKSVRVVTRRVEVVR